MSRSAKKNVPTAVEPRAQETLVRRLARANTSRLLELIGDHALTVQEVRQVLRNPYTTTEVIELVLGQRQLLSVYEIKNALARHFRTPVIAAQGLIPALHWNDLLHISLTVRIHPRVRHLAEKYLIERLRRLSVGEKISLARRATPEVLRHLRQDPDPRVLRALLESARLTEELTLTIAANPATRPQILALVAESRRWGRRYSVRRALVLNPGSPFRVLFDLLPTMRRQDLLAAAELEAHSSIVRHRARELFETRHKSHSE